MVIEFLTFTVPAAEQDEWLRIEEQHWSRFLERQDGFVRKEIWRPVHGGDQVHAVIWWESMEHWKGEIGVKVPLANLPEGATETEVVRAVTFFVGAGDAWIEGDYMVVYSPGYWAVIGA